jgi:predicted regulator of Ras-like GTPase activity (Roadblock/LC7/MglB family)
MPLVVSQLIYTSFPDLGFKLLTSAGIPQEIQTTFIEQIVYRYWDSYNPPMSGYRAAYLQQINIESSLFGWLYNDENDDLGRFHIPFFICYYLPKRLYAKQLNQIFALLYRGPLKTIDRHNLPASLESTVLPDLWSYQPARIGVEIPASIRQQSHTQLQHGKLLDLFVNLEIGSLVGESKAQERRAEDSQINSKNIQPKLGTSQSTKSIAIIVEEEDKEKDIQQRSSIVKVHLPQAAVTKFKQNGDRDTDYPTNKQRHIEKQPMNTNKIEAILQDLAAKPIGIQSAILVSSQGQPLTPPIGIDENSAAIVAGTMLYLAKSTCEELKWEIAEKISVQGSGGHVILTSCGDDIFLLVKAGKTLTGLLDGEINRTVKNLQVELQAMRSATISDRSPPQLNPERFQERTPVEEDSEIRYRGRRTSF